MAKFHSRIKDMTDQVFTHLTAIRIAGIHKRGALWLCRCECGNEKIFTRTTLVRGDAKSCGCFAQEDRLQNNPQVKHRMTKTREFRSWESLKSRCDNVNDPFYRRYGGRGITYDIRWKEFINFYVDMGPRPLGSTIERKDNDGNYTPHNCIWADAKTQARNRKSTHYMTLHGVKKSLTEWSELLNISTHVIYYRLKKAWSDEKILSTPVREIHSQIQNEF